MIPMVISPVLAIAVSYPFMLLVLWVFRNARYHRTVHRFRWAQVASAAAMAFGHGTQDAQKTMGVITLTLVVSGHLDRAAGVPLWVILASAAAMALGTYSGGWRIMRTVGRRIYALTPVSGFAAETSASAIMLVASHFGFPISTTHVISTSIMGVGATRRLSAVRWGVAGNIVTAWVLTMPAAGLLAAAFGWIFLGPRDDIPAGQSMRTDPGGAMTRPGPMFQALADVTQSHCCSTACAGGRPPAPFAASRHRPVRRFTTTISSIPVVRMSPSSGYPTGIAWTIPPGSSPHCSRGTGSPRCH